MRRYEFVYFHVLDFKGRGTLSSHYLAFILPAGQPYAVQMIDLTEAEPVNKLIQEFQGQIEKFQPLSIDGQKKDNLLWGGSSEETVSEPKTLPSIWHELRQAIFDPIRPALGESKHLFIAPDSALSLVPFGILPDDETGEQRLMDTYTISYLSSGRDLLRSQIEINRPTSDPLILADPNFDLAADQSEISEEETASPQPEILEDLEADLNDSLGGSLRPTQMTERLAKTVAQKLGVEPYLQDNALEPYLTSITKHRNPQILLIGTHGRFKAPPKDSTNPVDTNQWLSSLNKLSPAKVDNPMSRSQLALAGCNTWSKGGILPKVIDKKTEKEFQPKGMVTAQDVAGLDLWGNELTVLSACQTGVGDVDIVGEGVFGLRRAFVVAGAKTLIVSLWSVSDRATALLMERFFDNLEAGLGRGEALQEAQNYLRTITVAQLRQSDLGLKVLKHLFQKHLVEKDKISSETPLPCDDSFTPLAHPYFWGAWVCQGQTKAMPENWQVAKVA